MADDLDLRLLRCFVAVAEELHFTRAARQLYVSQQVLSRDIRRLEERLGVALFERTTRRVALTNAGAHLLARARELIALNDQTLRELSPGDTSMLVDIVGQGLTPARVLAAAREYAPATEFFARFHDGLSTSVPLLLSGELHVTFGRWDGLTPRAPAGVEHRLVRFERISVLLPDRHPLAALESVPLAALRTAAACWRSGSHITPEWEDAAVQLLASVGADVDPGIAHPHVRGIDELAHHVHSRNAPVLTLSSQPPVPGAVVRPLVDPVTAYPWSMIWSRSLDHPGLRALHRAVDELAAAEQWWELPPGAWLPHPEAAGLAGGGSKIIGR